MVGDGHVKLAEKRVEHVKYGEWAGGSSGDGGVGHHVCGRAGVEEASEWDSESEN